MTKRIFRFNMITIKHKGAYQMTKTTSQRPTIDLTLLMEKIMKEGKQN